MQNKLYKMESKNKQIFLKKVTRKDLEKIKNWRNSKGVWEFNTQYTLLNQFNQKQWYDELLINSSQKMFIIYNSQKKAIGICGFRDINSENKNADVSIILGDSKDRGKKLGTETLNLLVDYGFNKLNLHHISASIFSYNFKSIKVFEKMNFKLDAIMRDCIWRNGKWWDIYKYSVLSEEYKNKQNFEVIAVGNLILKAKLMNQN
jgi:RimJ/RimL family protein N-acetyltransferase|tara:strand:+ start:216 stop:827 length:612 start_codon:yes stop_codon:yes gene_type:complete